MIQFQGLNNSLYGRPPVVVCAKCRFYEHNTGNPLCMKTARLGESEVHMVTGEKTPAQDFTTPCSEARILPDLCGREARWFVPKPEIPVSKPLPPPDQP